MDSTLDRVEEDEEYGNQYDEDMHNDDGEDALSENELNIIKQSAENDLKANEINVHSDDNDRAYQNPLCRPIAVVGNTKIGLSTARLYGISLDENGNVKLNNDSKAKKISKDFIKEISKPRDLDLSDIAREPEPSFQPAKSKEALQAMKNKKCGYDFIERLNDRGDFLSRMHQAAATGKGKVSKWELESMKDDYEARLDKLQCPKCKKPQSFDEFFEKRRNCNQCQVKFEKLNVSSGLSFEKKMQQQENKRLEKLRQVEEQMYGQHASYRTNLASRTVPRPASSSSSTGPLKASQSRGRPPVPLPGRGMDRSASISRTGTGQPYIMKPAKDGVYRRGGQREEEGEEIEEGDVDRLLQRVQKPSTQRPEDILKKMAQLQQEKVVLIERNLSKIAPNNKSGETKGPSNDKDSGKGGPPLQSRARPSSAPATRPGKKTDDVITQKFQRLVSS